MSEIVARIKKYLDELGVKPSVAEVNIGVANGTLSKPFKKNTSIKTDTLEKFLIFYKKINPIWLLAGEGDIEKGVITIPSIIEIDNNTIITQNKLIAMQEKEIARLESEITKLKKEKNIQEHYSHVAEPREELKK